MPSRGATWLSALAGAPQEPPMAVSVVNGSGSGSTPSGGGSAYYVPPTWRYLSGYGRHQTAPRSSPGGVATTTPAPPPSPPQPSFSSSSRLPSTIPRDPRLWTREDVRKWLSWCETEFDLPSIDANQFSMNGKALCLLMKTDFMERSPRAGDVLHNAMHVLLVQATVNEESTLRRYNQHYRMYCHSGGSLLTTDNPSVSNWATAWPCVSSDYHNVGHVIHQSRFELPPGGGAESTVTLSPAPSTDSQSGSPTRVMEEAAATASPPAGDSPERPLTAGSAASDSRSSTPPPSANPAPRAALAEPLSSVGAHEQPVTNGRLLWDFLHQLLNDPSERYVRCIAWKERDTGVFKIVDPHGLAQLWGMQKNHLNMNFDKMSRALRYYYRVNILRKVQGERHCYQFLRQPIELKACKQRALLNKYCGIQGKVASATNAPESIPATPVAVPIKLEMDSP